MAIASFNDCLRTSSIGGSFQSYIPISTFVPSFLRGESTLIVCGSPVLVMKSLQENYFFFRKSVHLECKD